MSFMNKCQFAAVAALILIISVIGAPSTNELPVPNLEIIGGHDTNISLHPWQVSLHAYGIDLCAGVLISDQWVLTAAYCLFQKEVYKNLTVRVGSTSCLSGGQIIRPMRVIVHEDFYIWGGVENSTALIKLETPVSGPNIKPISLPPANLEVAAGSPLTITGWGFITDKERFREVLQEIVLPQMAEADCKADYNKSKYTAITERMFCAGFNEGGNGTCTGDYGNPAVYKNQVVGIAAFNYGCGQPNRPAIFTKISKFVSWIHYHMENS